MRVSARQLVMRAISFSVATAIEGTVKDGTSAILPGVTIDAASDVLMERTRTVISDGSGRYQIVSLRPGTYTLTFSLEGFETVIREKVSLETDFTAFIDIDMRVGTLQEIISVSAQAPIVDVQSTVVSREELMPFPGFDRPSPSRWTQIIEGLFTASIKIVNVGGDPLEEVDSLNRVIDSLRTACDFDRSKPSGCTLGRQIARNFVFLERRTSSDASVRDETYAGTRIRWTQQQETNDSSRLDCAHHRIEPIQPLGRAHHLRKTLRI